jgi:hypothetical protein
MNPPVALVMLFALTPTTRIPGAHSQIDRDLWIARELGDGGAATLRGLDGSIATSQELFAANWMSREGVDAPPHRTARQRLHRKRYFG